MKLLDLQLSVYIFIKNTNKQKINIRHVFENTDLITLCML